VAQVGDAQANLKPVARPVQVSCEWTKNDRIVVEANDDHWSGKPAVRRATWRPTPRAGRASRAPDGAGRPHRQRPPDQLQALAATKTVRVVKTPSCRIIYFGIAQIKGGPAATGACGRRSTTRWTCRGSSTSVLLGNGKRINSSMTANVWATTPPIPVLRYNPKKAKELLAWRGRRISSDAAGAERALGRWTRTSRSRGRPAHGERHQDQCEIIGEWGSYVRSCSTHKTEDIFMNGWCLPSLEPDPG